MSVSITEILTAIEKYVNTTCFLRLYADNSGSVRCEKTDYVVVVDCKSVCWASLGEMHNELNRAYRHLVDNKEKVDFGG